MKNIVIKNDEVFIDNVKQNNNKINIKIPRNVSEELNLFFTISNNIQQNISFRIILEQNSKLKIKNVCCGCSKSNHNISYKITLLDNSNLYWVKDFNWKFNKITDKIELICFNKTRTNINFNGSISFGYIKEDIKIKVLKNDNKITINSTQFLTNGSAKVLEKLKTYGNNNNIEMKTKVGLEFSKSYIFMFSSAIGKNNNISSKCEEIFLTDDSIAKSIPIIHSKHASNKISHEARIGDIDKEKLYYLINRGIEPNIAKKLII